MCLPALAPIGAALLGTTGTAAAAGTMAAAVGTMSVLSPIASGALSLVAQGQQASAQAEMQRRATLAENARYSQQAAAARKQQATESLRLAQEVAAANKASMEGMARKQVAAGEAGIGLDSSSYLAEMRDLERQVAEHSYISQQNEYLSNQAYQMRVQDMSMASQANLININQPIGRPDYLGTMLNASTKSLGAYSRGLELKASQEG